MQKIIKPSYPDISKIIAAKTERRQRLAALSWEEKIAIISKMQELLPKGKWRDRISHDSGEMAFMEAKPTRMQASGP
ncbi:MAG: hypothetical protein DRI57_04225 [Deltaproteobacteria bacterium]|nr:MAG: hypothetical protein DRI57_04225 [Deltaproteobacteria bacterium]